MTRTPSNRPRRGACRPAAPDPNKVTLTVRTWWSAATQRTQAKRVTTIDVLVGGVRRLTLFRYPDDPDNDIAGWTHVPVAGDAHFSEHSAKRVLHNILGPLDFKRPQPVTAQEAA